MRNVIMKSFENFVTSPLSILKNKIIHLASLKSSLTDTGSIEVEVLKDTIQINVINSENAYNLMSTVLYKRKMKELRELESKIDNKKSGIFS